MHRFQIHNTIFLFSNLLTSRDLVYPLPVSINTIIILFVIVVHPLRMPLSLMIKCQKKKAID